jgi:hypothetical protein
MVGGARKTSKRLTRGARQRFSCPYPGLPAPHLRRGAFRMAGFAPTRQIIHIHQGTACLYGNDVVDLLGRPAAIDAERLVIQDPGPKLAPAPGTVEGIVSGCLTDLAVGGAVA